MFLSELSPIFKEIIKQPLAFTGGFFSGMLRLNFNEDPLASWLAQQGFEPDQQNISTAKNSQGPQSISIE